MTNLASPFRHTVALCRRHGAMSPADVPRIDAKASHDAGRGMSIGQVYLQPPRDCGADIAAEIRFHDGFWITPSPDVPLSIAEVPFTQETPLVAGADLFIGSARLRVETLQPAMPPAPANYASARAKSR